MKELIRKVLREFVEEPEEFVEEPDLCRIKFDYFNVKFRACYLNFSDSDDIQRIKNNDGECEEIEIYNELGESFIIPIDEIKFTLANDKPYIHKNYFYEKLYPQLNVNTKLVGGIASKNIKEALKISFKGTPNWTDETEDMSEGVINIEPTVGGNNWSVMNYFDTKKTVHDRLKALISQDRNQNPEIIYGDDFDFEDMGILDNKEIYDELVINWLSKVFKGEIHADKLDDIKNIQRVSIESGLETENDAIDYIKNHPEVLGLNGITETVMYEPGHKKDRWGGVDVQFYGDGTGPIGVQIKPLSKYNQIKNSVNVGSTNKNDYKGKKDVDYLVFFNQQTNEIVVFENSNYTISGSSYVFDEQPIYPVYINYM
jgi:hypothetical protein